MKQALIPVDEDGLEPQVCVIEVCMILACVNHLMSVHPSSVSPSSFVITGF